MILLFPNNSQVSLVMMQSPVLLNKIFLMRKEIRIRAEAAKQFFEEEQDLEISQTSLPCSKTEGLKLSSLETPAF